MAEVRGAMALLPWLKGRTERLQLSLGRELGVREITEAPGVFVMVGAAVARVEGLGERGGAGQARGPEKRQLIVLFRNERLELLDVARLKREPALEARDVPAEGMLRGGQRITSSKRGVKIALQSGNSILARG
jgi:hypothetical protein